MSKIVETIQSYGSYTESEVESALNHIFDSEKPSSHRKEVYETLLSCLDLTSLNTTDTEDSISTFTERVNSFGETYPQYPNVAAICVYPSMVSTVRDVLTEGVEIASVAAGFPSSQTFIEVKVAETALAVLDGASEIDVVISLGKMLDGKLEETEEELREIKDACKGAHLKVILESGALSLTDLKNAAVISMEAGADFIKTSTGKQLPAATTVAAWCMCQFIREYHEKTGRRVGFKAAGGIATVEDALDYYCIVKSVLGEEWLNKDLFRIGASRLANALVSELEGKTLTVF